VLVNRFLLIVWKRVLRLNQPAVLYLPTIREAEARRRRA
jgi:hypothetical protein